MTVVWSFCRSVTDHVLCHAVRELSKAVAAVAECERNLQDAYVALCNAMSHGVSCSHADNAHGRWGPLLSCC